jgi:hypothetical protein
MTAAVLVATVEHLLDLVPAVVELVDTLVTVELVDKATRVPMAARATVVERVAVLVVTLDRLERVVVLDYLVKDQAELVVSLLLAQEERVDQPVLMPLV